MQNVGMETAERPDCAKVCNVIAAVDEPLDWPDTSKEEVESCAALEVCETMEERTRKAKSTKEIGIDCLRRRSRGMAEGT